MKKELLPSDFMEVFPWGSVLQNAEKESLACSIMATRNMLGNYWAGSDKPELSYQDYVNYRKSINGDVASMENFDRVAPYCKFPDTAILFSDSWKKLTECL